MTQADLVIEHIRRLPDQLVAEVLDFVQLLEQKRAVPGQSAPREPGSAKGLIWIADDFDAPIDDFKDYQ